MEKVNLSMIKKEPDGTWVVKVIYGTISVYGYGKNIKDARLDASDNLSTILGKRIKVIL